MNIRIAATCVLLATMSSHAGAFEPDHHWQITVDALTETKLRSTVTGHLHQFEQETAFGIADTAEFVDTATLFGYKPDTGYLHCDDAQLERCMDSVRRALDRIVRALAAHDDDFGLLEIADQAQFDFGWSMHTLQDFYSHSSWLNVGRKRTVDLRFPQQFAGATIQNCSGGGVVTTPSIFSSGVFSLTDDGDKKNAGAMRCVHGPYCTVSRLAPYVTDCSGILIQGLAKDHESSPLRTEAQEMARKSTTEAAYYVIQELERQRKFRAICAFTGEPIRNCLTKLTVAVPDVRFTGFAFDGEFHSLEDSKTVTFEKFNPLLGRLLYVEKKFMSTISGSGTCPDTVIAASRGCFFGLNAFALSSPVIGPFEYILCDSVGTLATNCGPHNPEPRQRTFYRANVTQMSVSVSVDLTMTETITARNRNYYIQAPGMPTAQTSRVDLETYGWMGEGVEDSGGPWPIYVSHGTLSGGVTMKTELTYVYSPAP